MPAAMAGSNTAPHLRERRAGYYPISEGAAEIFGWLRLDVPTMAGPQRNTRETALTIAFSRSCRAHHRADGRSAACGARVRRRRREDRRLVETRVVIYEDATTKERTPALGEHARGY